VVILPLTKEEIEEIREILGREPTQEELAMFEAQWSEHCSYKSSRLLLRLLPTKAPYVLVGPGRDAPAVEIFPGTAVVFKIESHNHPSAVDPYDGAATGIGGIIRDILTLGATPVALLDMLYMGEPSNQHAGWLIRGIVKGISDYGNRVGIPTVAGDTWFDKSFNRQPLVNVACVGVADTERLVLGGPSPGDVIIIAGNATGRDGILGSSFASRPLAKDADKDIAAVQVGDPLTEKLLIEVIRELTERRMVKFIKDLGGGGLTTAVSEAASDHGVGAEVHLERLHTREQGMTPLELLVSESQERMMLVTDKGRLEGVLKVLEHYGVPYSLIGRFDSSGRIRVYYEGKLVADVPAKDLAKPRAIKRASSPPPEVLKGLKRAEVPEPESIEDAILSVISSPNVASKKWIFEQYDHEVGIRTVIKPGYADAAILRLLDGSARGLAVKGDANPRYTSINPFRGAANSVAECFRNLVAVGSEPLAIVDELNAGNPEKPQHFWFFEQMVKGIAWMTDELELPVVGGKVSFYNEDELTGAQVKPTATIVGVGRIEDIARAATMEFKVAGSKIVIVGVTLPEIGASEYLWRVHGLEEGEVPVPRPSREKRTAELIRSLISNSMVRAVHDVGTGGIAATLTEMSATSGLGFTVDLSKIPVRAVYRIDEVLFSETQARYILEVPDDLVSKVLERAEKFGIDAAVIGEVTDNGEVRFVKTGKVLALLDLSIVRDLYFNTLRKFLEVT